MSANNNSSEMNGASSEPNLASELALRVALQTIKERCVSLHQRLAVVEEENLTIKSKLNVDSESSADSHTTESEVLREKLTKVTKEKLQLGEHIAMVTTENRQLWSRLSQLVKDQNNKQKKSDDEPLPQTSPTSGGNVQRLIRSETFTQHSPNVLLRPKPIVPTAAATTTTTATGVSAIASSNHNDEGSMEDVSLKQLGGYLDDKYGGGSGKAGSNDKTWSTLNFGYLNDEASRAGDFSQDLNNCAHGMHEMRVEMKRQQVKLKVLVDLLKERRANPQCSQCRTHREKPEMADKGSETDGSLSEASLTDKPSSPPSTLLPQKFAPPDPSSYDSTSTSTTTAHINLLEQKRLADDIDKMCPLCGKIYPSAVPFDNFREHVETHFIDDLDPDTNSVETNFEFISHTVGNF